MKTILITAVLLLGLVGTAQAGDCTGECAWQHGYGSPYETCGQLKGKEYVQCMTPPFLKDTNKARRKWAEREIRKEQKYEDGTETMNEMCSRPDRPYICERRDYPKYHDCLSGGAVQGDPHKACEPIYEKERAAKLKRDRDQKRDMLRHEREGQRERERAILAACEVDHMAATLPWQDCIKRHPDYRKHRKALDRYMQQAFETRASSKAAFNACENAIDKADCRRRYNALSDDNKVECLNPESRGYICERWLEPCQANVGSDRPSFCQTRTGTEVID